MEIALLNDSITNRNFSHERRTQAVKYGAFDLCCRSLWIDHAAAIHRSDYPVDFQLTIADADFSNLRYP